MSILGAELLDELRSREQARAAAHRGFVCSLWIAAGSLVALAFPDSALASSAAGIGAHGGVFVAAFYGLVAWRTKRLSRAWPVAGLVAAVVLLSVWFGVFHFMPGVFGLVFAVMQLLLLIDAARGCWAYARLPERAENEPEPGKAQAGM